MINVLIADDHPLIREGLKKTLLQESDMKVVCEAQNGQEVLDLLQKHNINVIVMDISMPGNSGLDVLIELKKRGPKVPVLILSMHPEERFAIRALKSGAAGYLTKESAPDELVGAIRKVFRGGKYITTSMAEKIAFSLEADIDKLPHEKLSSREFQVMCMLASGKSVQEIADELCLSINTVNTIRNRILEKMNFKTNSEIIHYALVHKLVDPLK